MSAERSPLAAFDFEGEPVRTLSRDGQHWFIAADVCRILNISNNRDAVASLDDDEKHLLPFSNVGNTDINVPNRGLQIISESGLYSLIFRSRKPQARAFRRWVTGEVLPALRTTGTYTTPGTAMPDPLAGLEERIATAVAAAMKAVFQAMPVSPGAYTAASLPHGSGIRTHHHTAGEEPDEAQFWRRVTADPAFRVRTMETRLLYIDDTRYASPRPQENSRAVTALVIYRQAFLALGLRDRPLFRALKSQPYWIPTHPMHSHAHRLTRRGEKKQGVWLLDFHRLLEVRPELHECRFPVYGKQ